MFNLLSTDGFVSFLMVLIKVSFHTYKEEGDV